MRRVFVLSACVSLLGLLTATPALAAGVSGVVRAEATGQPVAGACVSLFDLELHEVAATCADDAGRYSFADVAPGPYKARATASGFPEIWAYNRGSGLSAEVLNLPHNVDFTLQQGSAVVRGRITDETGAPAAGARVDITDANQRWWSAVETAADGTYEFTAVKADTYKLKVRFGDREQWLHQKGDFYSATSFTVPDAAVTVVDEAIQPYAGLRVVVKDSVSGAPAPAVCAQLNDTTSNERKQCADSGGVLRFDRLPANGYYTLGVWASNGEHWPADSVQVSLRAGEVTDHATALRPAATVRTTVQDARTGRPVENVCVETHTVPVVAVIDRDYLDRCSDSSGTLVLGPMDPGAYQLLVKPVGDNGYGMQWVGASGGTGDVREAIVVRPELNNPKTIAPIRMDRAGTISGVVTDRATGAGVNGVCVYPFAVDPRIGFGFRKNCTRDGGKYTITGLGPYRWPLEFADSRGGRYAWQWSGDAADRFAARPVPVWSGFTTDQNASLVASGQITGRTLDKQDKPKFGYVYGYNARTGDIVGWTSSDWTSGAYALKSLATQDVRLEYWIDRSCSRQAPVGVVAGQATSGVDLKDCS
ncbi:carboxypeptidase regulatory-like domain-containing protein [Lentzea tibetensis]|uniref:Carboxypeptidase regulatory-like domain-containing protein n=1 Tax=Lentzea tibetensis TaxID=2591470 RepID=A0A563EQ74_9PSEU|nr:carboxypeptidase-like regulatory domain-containing protein [Lentzea tibetensis]TWP49573.1 carboxypeptidase regulatory-like domain-containing protein [Lentzea tibetensis]